MPALIYGHLWYLMLRMTVAGERGGNDRNRRDRRVVPIDAGRRDRLGHAQEQISDEGALEGVRMLDRVTGGGPRIIGSSDDPPRRFQDTHPGLENPWTTPRPRAAAGTFGISQALPACRARQTQSNRRRPRLRSRLPRLTSITARKLQIAAALLLIIGLGATGVFLLTRGHPGVARQRTLVASTPQIPAIDAQEVGDQRRAMSLTIERLATERQATERRQARARAAARKRTRARAAARRARTKGPHTPPHSAVYAAAASPASSTASSATAMTSSAAGSTMSQSSPASSRKTPSVQSTASASEPTTTSTSPAPSSPSGTSTKQRSTPSKQPAFGSSGTLGPGSSPDS
jgi:hypothetical protein